jgi:hypothetical protein
VAIVQSTTKVHSFHLKAKEYSQHNNDLFGQEPTVNTSWRYILDHPRLNVPMILRNEEDNGTYSVIDDAFVYNSMDGEALRDGHLSLNETILQ